MSCSFGREVELRCTPSRANDCGSKGICGVWENGYPALLRREELDDCPECGGMMSDGKVGRYCPYCGVGKPKRNTEGRTVPAESFVATLSVNVNNEKLSDADFRELVRNTLPIVIYDVPRRG